MAGLKKDSLEFVEYTSEGMKRYLCPVCGHGHVDIEEGNFVGRCDLCEAFAYDYKPGPHQVNFHKSDALIRANIGGYGTGKTTSSLAEIMYHVLSVPNGKTFVLAQTLAQIKTAVLPELQRFIHKDMLSKKPSTKQEIRFDFVNGHILEGVTSDNEQKLRSANITAFYMEEASGIEHKIFTQLMTRLRNKVAIMRMPDGTVVDKRMGIICTNPEPGWIVDEFLLHSRAINGTTHVNVDGYQNLRKLPNKRYETFLSSTRDNVHLPEGYIDQITIGRTPEWIAQYVDSSLEMKQGAIYPNYASCVVDDFAIPKNWKRVIGFDKGYRDPTACVIGAVDPKDGTTYFYKEYSVPNQPIQYHANQLKPLIAPYELLFPIQADPTVYNKNDDGKAYANMFRSYSGLYLTPANNSIDAGIERVRTYMYAGKVKFFRSLMQLKEEMLKYVYKPNSTTGKEEPIAVNNHLMDALRYAIMGLPENPNDVENIIWAKDSMPVYDLIHLEKAQQSLGDVITVGSGISMIKEEW